MADRTTGRPPSGDRSLHDVRIALDGDASGQVIVGDHNEQPGDREDLRWVAAMVYCWYGSRPSDRRGDCGSRHHPTQTARWQVG
jgi:hypothetical protein